MNTIQIITSSYKKLEIYKDYVDITTYNTPNSFDNYKLVIIDLSYENLLKNTNFDNPNKNITLINDFCSIREMIENSKKADILVCLPQNIEFTCTTYKNTKYYQLKNYLPVFIDILKVLLPIQSIKIFYENNETKINDTFGNSAFGFKNDGTYEEITHSTSETITTLKKQRILITSLELIKNDSYVLLFEYLRLIGIIKDKNEVPDWVRKYMFYDDEEQMKNVEKSKEQIKKEKEKIDKANIKLDNNLHYKSILYTNSDELVKVVFEILEDIFDISLKEFIDEKKEDFNFKKDEITYIGEIKGVTSNVKNEFISQLDEHYAKYLDKLQEEGSTEEIRKLLIINYERTRDINERNEIHIMQDEMARKRDTLIIDTKSLLDVYELYLKNNCSNVAIINYINNNTGVIKVDNIKKIL